MTNYVDGESSSLPTSAGVEAAAARLKAHMVRSPLFRSEGLSQAFAADVWIKLETLSPIASFKLRGALNSLLVLRDQGTLRTAVTSSTGNHGQGVALAARLLGIRADIFLPEAVNVVKAAAIRQFGAHLHIGGRDIDDAKERARSHCLAAGGSFVDDGDDARLIEGAGTVGLEVAEDLADIDFLFSPMGSGALVSGVATAVKAKQPATKIVAVQSELAPAMVESFRERRAVEREIRSAAEAIVCRVPAAMALQTMLEAVDYAIAVPEETIFRAMSTLMRHVHVLAELGASAGLAGAWSMREELLGKRIVIVVTGANTEAKTIAEAVRRTPLFD